MLTLLLFFVNNNDAFTVPLSLTLTETEALNISLEQNHNNYSLEGNETLVELQESDKNLLRAVALFIGVLLVVSFLICICTMYWCICWALNCPGVTSSMRTFARGTRDSWNRWRFSMGSLSSVGKSSRNKRLSDPPPSYEAILAQWETDQDEHPPPTYTEAVCIHAGAT